MTDTDFHYQVSNPRMPGKFDAVFEEMPLADEYHAIAFDSDPYTNVTVIKGDTPLFTVLVADHKKAMPFIAGNIDKLLQEMEGETVGS
jgi:hypothetical protein